MLRPNDTKGKLIVVEGIDGSGKSTQIDLLYKWLLSKGYSVYFSEWNSSSLVKSTTKVAKKTQAFTPATFSILHCTDFADRWENSIYPLLKAGVIVLADRYAFTAFARDIARGNDPNWVRDMYSFAFMPDAALYFRVPLDIAVGRITGARAQLKYYEAGMDLGLSDSYEESFKLFQGKILNEYDKMVDEFGLTMIDGTLPVKVQQKKVRALVKRVLEGFESLPNPDKQPIAVDNPRAGKKNKKGKK
ncbi:MAG: dTMP kinase [Anaerolineaceae bacterium]|nr:dTMP kinase [Anaerolineaceae bacterium]